MCNCWDKHPLYPCGSEGCHCHDSPDAPRSSCPRCGLGVDRLTELSRLDHKTLICSGCANDEAMYQLLNRGADLPPFGEPLT